MGLSLGAPAGSHSRDAPREHRESDAICACGGDTAAVQPKQRVQQWDAAEYPCEALSAAVQSCKQSTQLLSAALADGTRLHSLAASVLDLQREGRYCKDPAAREAILARFEQQTQDLLEGLGQLRRRVGEAAAHSQPAFEEKFAEYTMALRAQNSGRDPAAAEEIAAYERELRSLADLHAQCAALAAEQQRRVSECIDNLSVSGDFVCSALSMWAQAKVAMRNRPTPLIGDRTRDTAHSLGAFGRMGDMRSSSSFVEPIRGARGARGF
eukprot:TRINITY_DN70005_c0_g1_i1.p1 TRINITY_DN70005_c0_g1~~TRINITY_DN70005_c0_g1_i1.p1  ORF type:complete len:293 (+),score=94.40 TRINITY_DN70005_c0_g1_i1:77-880(+)